MEFNQETSNTGNFNAPNFGQPNPMQNIPAKPNNYMALSIVSTVLSLCTCIGLIPGIVAIVMSSQSSTKYNQGDYQGSINSAKNAKILGFVTLGIFVLNMIYSYFQLQEMGGIEGFMEQMRVAIEAAENQ
ncbi:MAG: CD225/dispanin family protein [Flavobacteriaceae bacterium]|jgi:hypothetical protein|nr:CD225/dispanin family protein [Flavobacteriaceae bacterium]